jgi:SAM-dependent methyltransferase
LPDAGAWEEDYTRRGILWSNVPHDLPVIPLRSRVLELGCGNGKTLATMLQRGWDVTAIDFASQAVMLSRRLVRSSSLGDVMVADARVLPFKNNSFDSVFALHVIGHMHKVDRERIISELPHILKPGGNLFFSDFSINDFRFGKGNETEPATFQRGTGIITHYFIPEEVIDLFSKFTPLSISIHQWPMRVIGNTLVRSEIQAIFTR